MKKRSSSVFKPRDTLIVDRIQLVRKKRGLKAPGDVLLQAALRSVASNDSRTVKRDISKFLLIVPDVKPEERAILTNIEEQFKKRDPPKIVFLIIQALSWLFTLFFKLISKTPTGYKFPENISGLYIQ